MNVICPASSGSGAFLIHSRLRDCIAGYSLRPYSPGWELFPPAVRWFSRGKADLIHAPADYGIFSRRRNVPQILTLHGYNLDRAFRPYVSAIQKVHYSTDLRWILRHSLLNATVITAVSRFTAELALHDLGISRGCKIIPNGVDLSVFRPDTTPLSKGNVIRVLFCGNATKKKGALLLPAIADRLSPGIRIVCAAGLRSGGRDSHLQHPQIDFLGKVAPGDMPALYRSVDILLMSSYREGMSLALLEGMASGLPIIASDVASIPELIRTGKGGYLCPPGDTDTFAARINALAEDPVSRVNMGQYNRSVAETNYDERRMVAAYKELFVDVCDNFNW